MALPSFLTKRPAFLSVFDPIAAKRDKINKNVSGVATDIRNLLAKTSIIAPAGIGQIDAFFFDYKGDETVTVSADVTDHWMEDNTVAHDHIGLKPVEVTLSGFIAEVSLDSGFFNNLNTIIQGAQTGLVQLSAVLGKYAPGATDKLLKILADTQNIALQIERALQIANSILNFFVPGPEFNKQQAAFNKLSVLCESRHLNTVITPFKRYDNMAITSLRAVQKGDSRMVSSFTVTLKQLKFVGEFLEFDAIHGGRSANDNQEVTKNGVSSSPDVASSSVVSPATTGVA